MITLLDIGNTRTKYCTVESGVRSKLHAIANEDVSPDFLSSHFGLSTKLITACVSHEKLINLIATWCDRNNTEFHRVKSESKKNNVISGYEIPEQLGVDRWLTIIAASELYPKMNVLIIDAGTATTIDFLTESGQHKGGWILAGVTMLVSTLLMNTSQVSARSKENPSIRFGTDTSENVHNGSIAATIGAIQLAISEINSLDYDLNKVIITGGNAHILSPLLTNSNIVIDELVFVGLQAYI